MRVSADPEDRGFNRDNIGKVDIYLDGVHVPYVVTADVEEAFILAHRPHPEHGGKFYDRIRDVVATVEYRGGTVEIRRRS